MENKIKETLSKNNGYITTKELVNLGIKKNNIPYLIERNILKKVCHGIYIDVNVIEDEYYILQLRYSNIVFSYNTAFHILDLSDRAPYKLDITVKQGKKINTENKVQVHYVMDNKFDIGIIEVNSPYGNPIKIYNAERCICDMLKNQNEYDIELYTKIINNYFASKEKNLILLDEYAHIFNVYDKLTNIMEVLIK